MTIDDRATPRENQGRTSESADEPLRLSLPAEPAAVSIARRAVGEQWSHLTDEVLGDVELIVAELVSKAGRTADRRSSYGYDGILPGARFAIEADTNLVVYSTTGAVLWSRF